MLNVARIGDITAGVCCCHDGCKSTVGVIVTGSETATCENSEISRIGDIVIGNCGHVGIIVTGANTNTCEKSNVARITDVVIGCLEHIIVTGAESTTSESGGGE